MAIRRTAAFTVRPESGQACEEAIRMEFEDEAAEDRHRTSEAVRRFTSALYPQTVDGVTFTEHREVATA